MPKASLQPGEPEEIPCEGSDRDPPGNGACVDSRVAGASEGLRRGIGRAILSDIIVNDTLNLLQINYLVQKEYILFNFPSRSHFTCNQTYGKT